MNEFDQKALEWDKNKMHLERTIAVAGQMQKMIPFRAGMKAMEFGAGTGLLSLHLKDHFSEITMMDSSEEMLKMASQKVEEGDRSKFKTLFLNLEKEEYTGDPFDIIYSQMVLHHIRDVQSVLKKFYDFLTPGGILAIADLYTEDGSFHEGDPSVHFGFDPGGLSEIMGQLGFTGFNEETCFIIRKAVSPDVTREYPVFLLTATKI